MERESLPLSSSSCSGGEEEEDRQTLIDQNQFEGKSPKRSSSSIFHIDNLTGNPLNATKNKSCYIFAIFLSFFIIILLFLTTDLNSLLFSSQPDHSSPHNDNNLHSSPILNRMRDSELQALNLLRTQQLGLLTLYSINQSASFKSHLLTQISLNNHIQQLLLSTHQPIANTNSGLHDNATDPSFLNMNVCGKLDQKLTQRKTVQWRPKGDNYLFAICVSGQMSNHLICLQNHMFFAALLNRVLVIPSAKVDYQFNRVLDIDHINKCFGRNVVVTFEEFAEAKKSHLHIDKFFCYFSKPQPCFLDDDHLKKLKSLGMTMNKLEPAWSEDVKNPSKKTIQDVVSKFSSNDDVIAIGDVFFADVERDMVMQPGGPIAHKCKTLIEPSRLIMLTAQRFVQTFLGERFIALHFRRHGFLKFCNAKSPSCFFPIPQAADCISRLVEKANTPVIYLSTDAAESETNLLQSLIVLNGKTVPLVKRPARNSAEKWDALLYRHGIEGDAQVEAMLDKTISAMSSVFIGASGSTFTEDILRLRKDWGSASLCDEYLCQGEVPNFIADNE